MFFHAGQDFVLKTDALIGIFDLDTAGASRRTQAFFRTAEKGDAVVDLCAPGAVPRSFLVMDLPARAIYLSPLSPKALRRRTEEGALEGPAPNKSPE